MEPPRVGPPPVPPPSPPGEGRSPLQLVALAAIGGVVLAVAAVLLVVWAIRDRGTLQTTRSPSTTTTVTEGETTTTVDLVAGTTTTSTTAPSTTTTAADATTSTTAATTTSGPAPAVDGRGAVLQPPPPAPPRELAPGQGCEGLAGDEGWEVRCGTFRAGDVTLAWVVESRDLPLGGTAHRAHLFRRGSGSQWTSVLEARDDDGSEFAEVNVRVGDASGDGVPEVAYGFRRLGSASLLAVDLVQAPGTVVVHRRLAKGAARLAPGQLDTWAAAAQPGDPSCCPSQYRRETIAHRSGAWRIVATSLVRPEEVPPSHL